MSTPTRGTLFLVPNTLDFGVAAEPAPIDLLLPRQTLLVAARLTHWVAESAKTTRAFLKRVDAVVPLGQPLQQLAIVELPRPPKGAASAPEPQMAPLLAPALAGHDIGLISEAGLPAVADPGAGLVRAAHRAGIGVEPLSGASALLLALAASGLNGQSFAFVGYLPVDRQERAARLRELEGWSRRHGQTQLLIETPYRNATMLEALLATLQPTTELAVGVALTAPGGFNRSDTVAGWRRQPTALPADRPAVFAFLGR